MASSYLHSLPDKASHFLVVDDFSDNQLSSSWMSILVLMLISFSFIAFVIPEKPQYYASICEKHNSPSACQVW